MMTVETIRNDDTVKFVGWMDYNVKNVDLPVNGHRFFYAVGVE